MQRRKDNILQEGKRYTFRDYFELKYSSSEILIELGYIDIGSFADLQNAMLQILPKVPLTSETARREFYISPFMWDLLRRIDFQIDIEYHLEVNDYLRGVLDYLLRSTESIIVVEAKKADMDRGFTQLAVELIAVSESFDGVTSQLYGAVTIGDTWQFGMLDVPNKIIYKDINQFYMPKNIDEIAAIFAGILSGK